MSNIANTETQDTKRTGKRSNEAEILATWNHVVPKTLRYDEEGLHANKQTVEIRTRDINGQPDGKSRRIATSDLFQCFWTEETKDHLDRAKRSAKRKLSTKSRDEGLESLAKLDTVEAAQVACCKTPGHPRIVKARAAIAEAKAKLDAKAEAVPTKADKPKAEKPKRETVEERKARLAKAEQAA